MDPSFCFVLIVLIIGGFLVFRFMSAGRAAERIREAEHAYRDSLAALKNKPSDATLKQRTLELGRMYSALTREGKRTTVFDEMTLMNDLNAATAGAASTAPIPAVGSSVEERLKQLDGLRDKGIVTAAEYEERRAKILGDL